MSKKVFHWMLMAALTVGLGMSVTSCKDDDDEKEAKETKEEAEQRLVTFWDVIGQLVSADDYTDDYANATFEPTYGIADATNSNVRIVNTNDMETAAYRFASLVGANINASTASYTWENEEAGSMTYTRTGNGQSWAEVDVNIKQIPHLQKIIYRSPEQAGLNGSFEGTAFYRFGDVVKRTYTDKKDKKQKEEYWICVRPAFGPAGKEDSHWVSLSQPPKANIYEWTSDDGIHFGLPTGISKNEEQMQNLAELLFAITHSDEWGNNLTEKATKPKMWHDFIIEKRYPYNNKYFFKRVRYAWEKRELFTTLFGYEYSAVKKKKTSELMAEDLTSNTWGGLHLLYKGYSWISGWSPTLYGATFTNGEGKEANMHHLEYITYCRDVQNAKNGQFDISAADYNNHPYLSYAEFFGDRANHYVVRHATGKDLAKNTIFNPSVYESLSKSNPEITDVYTYNAYYNIVPGKTTPPENSLEEKDVPKDEVVVDPNYVSNAIEGCGTYMFGDVVEDEEGSKWFCVTGAPHSDAYPAMTDKRAMFISFDNIKTEGNVATNIIKENELPDVFARLTWLYSYLTGIGNQNEELKLQPDKLGTVGEHIRDYTSVDLTKIVFFRDSVWRFQNYNDKEYYDSKSLNAFFNLAYNDGGNNRQPIARVVNDVTQAGSMRSACTTKSGAKIQHWRYRLYKHYEIYNPDEMQGPSEDEASVGMTLWQTPWATTTDKMYLDDVTSPEMIQKYAAADKWVRLPNGTAEKDQNIGAHNQPRTVAETSARPEDFIWKNGAFATNKTSIFNEPVLFLRIMWVEDNYNNVPNLVSTDGRRLKVVHMLNDTTLYISMMNMLWAGNVYNNCYPLETCAYSLDNKLFNVCEGWPQY